jgi:hypothetical protein
VRPQGRRSPVGGSPTQVVVGKSGSWQATWRRKFSHDFGIVGDARIRETEKVIEVARVPPVDARVLRLEIPLAQASYG